MSSGSEEIIEITISKDGAEIELDAKGFSGKGCSVALNELSRVLGDMSKMEKKKEFYNKDLDEDVTITTK